MKGAPIGTGMVDLKAVIAELKANGYEGDMSVEFQNKPDGDFQASLTESREYLLNLV